jgi:hypothetical protein
MFWLLGTMLASPTAPSRFCSARLSARRVSTIDKSSRRRRRRCRTCAMPTPVAAWRRWSGLAWPQGGCSPWSKLTFPTGFHYRVTVAATTNPGNPHRSQSHTWRPVIVTLACGRGGSCWRVGLRYRPYAWCCVWTSGPLRSFGVFARCLAPSRPSRIGLLANWWSRHLGFRVDPLYRERSSFLSLAESSTPSSSRVSLPRGTIRRGASLHERQGCNHRYR